MCQVQARTATRVRAAKLFKGRAQDLGAVTPFTPTSTLGQHLIRESAFKKGRQSRKHIIRDSHSLQADWQPNV